MEQTFGTFVSANTSIVNDKLTKDEIVSISTGNIKKFKELSSAALPNGHFAVVLEATISLSKLTTYAKSHGSQCEFAGNTFAQNMNLRELYRKNEAIVIDNMLKQLELMIPNMFQYSISVTGEPKEAGRDYNVPVSFSIKATENSEAAFDLIKTTLSSIRLNDSEKANYESTNSRYYSLEIEYYRTETKLRRDQAKEKYYFRNSFPEQRFVDIINSALSFNVYALMNNSTTICQYGMNSMYTYDGHRNDSYSPFYLAETRSLGNTIADILLRNFHLWSHLTKSTDTSTDFLIAGAIKKAKAKKYNAQRHFGNVLVGNGYVVVNKADMSRISGFEIVPPNKTSSKKQERRRY